MLFILRILFMGSLKSQMKICTPESAQMNSLYRRNLNSIHKNVQKKIEFFIYLFEIVEFVIVSKLQKMDHEES